MTTKRTEWTEAGWTFFEVRNEAGKIIEEGCTSPSQSYDYRALRIAIPVDALEKALSGKKP